MRCLRPRVGAAGGSDTDPSSPGAPPGSFLGKVRPGRQEVCGPHTVHPLGPGEEVLSWEDTTEQRGLGARGAGKGGRSAPAPAPRRLQGCHAGALGSFYFPSFGPAVPQVWLREALSAPNCSGRQREPAFEGGTRCVCQHVPAAADSADSGPGDVGAAGQGAGHGPKPRGAAPRPQLSTPEDEEGSQRCAGVTLLSRGSHPPVPAGCVPRRGSEGGGSCGVQGAAGARSSQGLSRYPHGCLGMDGSLSPSGRPRKCHDSVTRAPRCPLPRAGLRSPVGDGVPGRAKALGRPQPATAPLRVPRVPATASRRQSPAQVVPCWIRHLHGNPPAQAVRAREMPSPRKRGGRAGRDAQPGTARTAGTPPVPPAPGGTPPRPAARPCPRHRGGGEARGNSGELCSVGEPRCKVREQRGTL